MAKRKRPDATKEAPDSTGTSPKPTRNLSASIKKSKRQPSPVLLDLVHTFLKAHHYQDAARALNIDSKFKDAFGSFGGTARGLPQLDDIYKSWAKEHKSGQSDLPRSPSPNPNEELEENRESKQEKKSTSESESGSSSSSESSQSSSSSSESEESISNASEAEDSRPSDAISKGRRVKSAHTSETDDNKASKKSPSLSTSSDSSSESSSDSGSSSGSDSHSEDEEAPRKKHKVDQDKKAQQGDDVDPARSSSSSSESGSSSDSSSESSQSSDSLSESDEESKKEASEAESKSDKSSDDSSQSSSDSDEEIPAKPKSPSPKQKPARQDTSDSSGSASSSTLKGASPLVPNVPSSKNRPKSNLSGSSSSKRKRDSPSPLQAPESHEKRLKHNNQPFSRVPKDLQVDPRFASNKYVPYDYADRAHRDLSITKGKGFTKEKNKKKRGAYRGGYIDTAPKGIKFDD